MRRVAQEVEGGALQLELRLVVLHLRLQVVATGPVQSLQGLDLLVVEILDRLVVALLVHHFELAPLDVPLGLAQLDVVEPLLLRAQVLVGRGGDGRREGEGEGRREQAPEGAGGGHRRLILTLAMPMPRTRSTRMPMRMALPAMFERAPTWIVRFFSRDSMFSLPTCPWASTPSS